MSYCNIQTAIEMLDARLGHRYTASHVRYLCQNGGLSAIKTNEKCWMVSRESLESFNPEKRGLKKGQKIRRCKKGLECYTSRDGKPRNRC